MSYRHGVRSRKGTGRNQGFDLVATIRNGITGIWNDWTTYDGTQEDFEDDAFWGNMLPVVGSFQKYRDDIQQMRDTMQFYGLSYDNIRYPTHSAGYRAYGSLANSIQSGVQFVSKNVGRLYR